MLPTMRLKCVNNTITYPHDKKIVLDLMSYEIHRVYRIALFTKKIHELSMKILFAVPGIPEFIMHEYFDTPRIQLFERKYSWNTELKNKIKLRAIFRFVLFFFFF